ncbi:hypothetical protein QFC21_004891 [Naganishia friedmannii]|uniref:Uncharacterized protein n=1 Tax=Naganishia friedmannii TaxID=89922 RepID=A0ACC2VD44_9TREE|nr:hypothetical protein QFC21_004891 [Naganishia friedmannii]
MSATTVTPPTTGPHICIVGGGIIGVCTAYYLSLHPSLPSNASISIIEATAVASGASGKAGGLLAEDWHGGATAGLAKLSYRLHAELAQEFGGEKEWGFRKVDTLSITTDATGNSKKASPVDWLPRGTVLASRVLGTTATTSQVHPELFTKYLLEKFLEKPRTSLIHGSATGLALSDATTPESLTITTPSGASQSVPCTTLILAAGPWTGRVAEKLLPAKAAAKCKVDGQRAHSIVLESKEASSLSAHALFTDMTLQDGSSAEPEVYCRPDGTAYICGQSDNEPLPATTADVTPSPAAITTLHAQARTLSPHLDVSSSTGATVRAEQACFLPLSHRGTPLIGAVPGVKDVYVASGHSCWGICNAPGTGKVLSELVLEGKAKSANVTALAP